MDILPVKIKGYENFLISKDGLLYKQLSSGRVPVKLFKDKDGYLVTSIQSNKKRIPVKIHRLVVQTFLNESITGKEINHIDGNKQNNRLSNLEIVNHKENMEHASSTNLLGASGSKYGLPYMGSKSKICDEVCRIIPKAENFYDLFGGGFSITHYMIRHRSKDFKQFHFNEIRKGICELVQDAIAGKYNYDVFKPEWVSREDFHNRKDIDAYVKLCWSFGNNGRTYLYGPDIEDKKRSLHNAVVFNQFDDFAKKFLEMQKFNDGYGINERRLFIRTKINLGRSGDNQLQQLQQLGNIQKLQQLQRIEALTYYNKSYNDIDIKSNSVIYCDPPYSATGEYDKNKNFNHKDFFDWADAQENPVFISEYNIPDKRFRLIKTIKKRSMLAPNKDSCGDKIEKIYVNKAGAKFLKII